jgi:hypothetical protein
VELEATVATGNHAVLSLALFSYLVESSVSGERPMTPSTRGQPRGAAYPRIREQGAARVAGAGKAIAQAVAILDGEDGLNKTERAYRDLLDFRKRAGEIRDFVTHGITFKLGKDCRYTPEFLVIENDATITIIEVKGFMRDDALVKFRTAQKQFPWFRFLMVQRCAGGWKAIWD